VLQKQGLYTLEKILDSGVLLSADQLLSMGYKFGNNFINIYRDLGFKNKISLGFYPTNQEIFEASKIGYESCLNKSIVEHIISSNPSIDIENLDDYLLNYGIRGDFAWKKYYSNIILLFSKKVLEDLSYSFGSMMDEICIDEPISISNYLVGIGIGSYLYEIDGMRCIELDSHLIRSVNNLLKEYGYDFPIVSFPDGENVYGISYVKCLKKK